MRTSRWWAGETLPELPPLAQDARAGVVVVGAGITGLTTALLLARAGRDVVVLEAERVGAGTTGFTSAHLTVETDTDLDELRRRVGDDAARAAVRANRAGLERIALLDREMGGRSGFRRVDGWLWGTDEQQLRQIERMAALYTSYGEHAEARVQVPLPRSPEGMRLRDQALFHPVRYLAGLLELATRAGVRIHEHSPVVQWEGGNPVRIATRQGAKVQAEHVVFATHTPPGLVPIVQARMAPSQSFLVVVPPREPLAPGLYWDMEDPYHYVRPLDDGQLLVGGADCKPGDGDPRDRIRELEDWAASTLDTGPATARWSHTWFEPADGLPYVGPLPARTGAWVATGFSGTGLTWGSFAAERIAAGIGGRSSPEDRFFSPSRLQLLGAADRLVQEGVSTVGHLVVDRLRPGTAPPVAELAPGEGGVYTVGGQKLAVYRDEGGELRALSATCRHMGCVVGWNALDRTWDCPCHGGRYHVDGTRFFGPPMGDLEPSTASLAPLLESAKKTAS